MNSLYLTDPVRRSFGDCLRPGGVTLTRRAISRIKPDPGWRILDAGCGAGGTLQLLKKEGFYRAVGIDPSTQLLAGAENSGNTVARAGMEALPFLSGGFDMILSECAWNLSEKKHSLVEFRRVLKPGGYLVINDIHLREKVQSGLPEWPVRCCFTGAQSLDETGQFIENHGFSIISVEDHSALLTRAAADFVFAHGSIHQFWQAVTGAPELADRACTASAATRPGLFLLIARKVCHA